MSRRLLGLAPVLVVVLVAATALGLVAVRPADTTPAGPSASTVPVEARTLTCFGLRDGSVRPTVAVGLAGVDGADPPAVDAGGLGLGDLGDRSTWTTRRATSRDATIAAQGPAAGGLDAFSAVAPDRSAGGGLAVQHCAEPTRRWWFVGAASTSSRSGTLLLRAPDDAEAVADVVLHGSDGVLDTVGTQDVPVAAGSTVSLGLADLAAGVGQVAVEVEASRGTVVAAVVDGRADAADPTGAEWLPAAAAPTETVLLPGVGGPGRSRLLIANPQERTAVARPALVTENGRAVLPELASVQVPAGGVSAVELPADVTPGSTVELRADAPISAAVRVVDASGSDFAAAVGASPLEGPAVLPVDLGAAADVDPASTLTVSALLTDPESQTVRTRVVALRGFDAGGATLGSGTLEIDAGTSRTVDLVELLGLSQSEAGDLTHVVARPRPGGAATVPVVAAFSATSRAGASVLPLASLRTTVTAPALVPRVAPRP